MQNPKVKEAVRLRDKRRRDRSGLFLIEGFREVLRALQSGWEFTQLFYCPEFFLGSNETKIIAAAQEAGAEVLECSRQVFEKLSYRDRPDGLLGISVSRSLTLEELSHKLEGHLYPFLVVCEAIEKPGNLGTILRTCDAVGADALIVCDECTDVFNPNVVRSSVGTLFSVPIVEATSVETRAYLKMRGISIVATTPDTDTLYTEADLRSAIAVCFGTEQYGLSAEWLENADLKVVIPMCGIADSLNVAISTGVMLYEVLRQRSE
ncbi:MAG: RNA methyltransferase [Chlamydiia bacterium]|nr:RNA methyltransferase [Chlamydiia bacterium]